MASDGKSSPFGDGNGKGAGGSAGTFDLQKGAGPSSGKAPPFDLNAQKNPQPSAAAVVGNELGGASGTPPGGLLPLDDIGKNRSPMREKEIGAGSVGNSQMPFRVGGGSKK